LGKKGNFLVRKFFGEGYIFVAGIRLDNLEVILRTKSRGEYPLPLLPFGS